MPLAPHLVAAALLSGLVGVSLGLLGGGGSTLAVPILVYVAGVAPRDAIGASLALVGTTSLLAAFLHARSGRVDLHAAATFGVAGLCGAPLGARLTHRVGDALLLTLFAALMMVVGALMLRGRSAARAERPRKALLAVLAAGFGVGVLTGFLGIGGGFLVVPALTLLTGLTMSRAVGTSLLVISLNAASGFVAHLSTGTLPVRVTLLLTATALAGAVVGTRAAGRWDEARLRRVFAVAVMIVGVFVAARNVPALLR